MKRLPKLFRPMSFVFISCILSLFFCKTVLSGNDHLLRCREDAMQTQYAEAIKNNRAAATYCFFNPDWVGCFGIPFFTNQPDISTLFEQIPIAICLQNDEAKKVFRDYFQKKKDKDIMSVLNGTAAKVADPRENVFVISFVDLMGLVNSSDIALCTMNGIIGGRNDLAWSWSEVLNRSRLFAGWKEGYKPEEGDCPSMEHRREVRILMNGLNAGKSGDTIRLHHAWKLIELYWLDGWTGEDVIF